MVLVDVGKKTASWIQWPNLLGEIIEREPYVAEHADRLEN